MRILHGTLVGLVGVIGVGLFGPGCAGDDASGAKVSCPIPGRLYDACREEHDCESANCRPFNAEMFTVCTQACTPGDNSTCPKQGNAEVECTAAAVCKPPMATACEL